MDNYIRKVDVSGLFGNRKISIDFDEHVNCIYGVNGSGKTTLINLIVACLSCDVMKLKSVEYKTVKISLSESGKKRAKIFLVVEKTNDGRIMYECEREGIKTFLDETEDEFPLLVEQGKKEVVSAIKKYITLDYVPLTRMQEADIYDLNRQDEYMLMRSLRAHRVGNDDISYILDPSKRMLVNLEKEFKELHSKVQNKSNQNLEELRGEIVSKVLINKELVEGALFARQDMFDVSTESMSHEDVENISKKFTSARININRKSIVEHFSLMDGLIKELDSLKIRMAKNDDENDDEIQHDFSSKFFQVLSLMPLYNKVSEIIDEINKTEEIKELNFSVFTNITRVINDFLINKSFCFTDLGGFSIKCGERDISLEDLSSGEKHMIALLGRVAISENEGSVFVADEPELSLHLEWQRKIIPSITSLSPNMQIIVATHSPAIIPNGAKKIDLMDCIS